LGEVQGPSISRQDACFCYSPRPFPCDKLPRERFSPSTLCGNPAARAELQETMSSWAVFHLLTDMNRLPRVGRAF
jgi:hypothetical protein